MRDPSGSMRPICEFAPYNIEEAANWEDYSCPHGYMSFVDASDCETATEKLMPLYSPA